MKNNSGDPRFDLRTLPRALREKRLTQKEVDDHLKKLPDEAAHTEEIRFHETKSPARPRGSKVKTKEGTFVLANEEAETV